MASVLFEGAARGLRIVATDSYRMAVYDIADVRFLDAGEQLLVPVASLRDLVTGRLPAGAGGGDFPDYRAVLAAPLQFRLVAGRQELAAALDEAADGTAHNDLVTLHLGPSPAFEGIRRRSFAATWDGLPISPRFRVGFLREGVRGLDGDTVHIDATDARRPIRIRNADDAFVYTVMPVPA